MPPHAAPPRPRPPAAAVNSPEPDRWQVWREWGAAVLQRLRGEEGASYLTSLGVHSVLLTVCVLLPTWASSPPPEHVVTLMQGGGGDGGRLGESIDTQLDLPLAVEQRELTIDPVLTPALNGHVSADFNPSLLAALDQRAGSPGQGGGPGGGGDGVDGIRIPNPSNAVRAGSFTVWAWPISGKNLKGDVQHGPPGSAPRVMQDYHIVIRVKVPTQVRAVKLTDFSGSVQGTDGYRQKIPDSAYHYTAKGELVSARAARNLPIVDGTVELLIEVPGAKLAQVEDTIKVVSQTLNEEQEIKLVFRAN